MLKKFSISFKAGFTGLKNVIKNIIRWKATPWLFIVYFAGFAMDLAMQDGEFRIGTIDLLGKTSIIMIVFMMILCQMYFWCQFVKTWKSL